jgi:integrase
MAQLNIKKNRHGNRFYQLDYSTGGKRYRPAIGAVDGPDAITPHDAQAKLDAIKYQLSSGKKVFTPGPRIKFGEFAAGEYLTWFQSEYPTSFARVQSIVRNSCAMLSDKFLDEIDEGLLERWKASRKKAPRLVRNPKAGRDAVRAVPGSRLSSNSVRKEVKQVKAILRKAIAWKRVAYPEDFNQSPARNVAPPKELNVKVQKYYSNDGLARLFKQPLHGDHWEWIANTGTRRGEATHITHGQVTVRSKGTGWVGEIRIESDDTTADARTKDAEARIIPLNAAACDAYRRIYKKAQLAFRALNHRLPTAAELADVPVLPKMSASSWSRAFKRDRDRCGLPPIKGSLVHALRHCFGSHAYLAGVPLKTIQEFLGHADIATTLRYVTTAETVLHQEIKKVRLGGKADMLPRSRKAS